MRKRKITKFAVSAILVGVMCGLTACGTKEKEVSEESQSEETEVQTEEPSESEEEKTEEDRTTEEDDKTTEEMNPTEESETEEERTPEAVELEFSSSDWTTLEFALDGTIYAFPLTYSDVKAAGFAIDEEYESTLLESYYYTMSTYAQNSENERFYVRFKNFTDEDKEIKDCDIYGFGFEMDEYRDVNPDVTLCNGVTFGMTLEEVKEIMGEPYYYYESEGSYDRKEMDYYEPDSPLESKLELNFVDGILNKITITSMQ